MSQLKKVVAEVVVPIAATGWRLDSLTVTLRALASQECSFKWRLSVVDGSKTETVQRLVRSIVPSARLTLEPLLLRTGMPSDLLYQGVSATKSRYVAYCMPGVEWGPFQLQHLAMAARKSQSDVIVQDGPFRDHGGVVRMFEQGADPCAGCMVLHSSSIYSMSAGWPRKESSGFHGALWRSMFLVGGEFFSVPRLDIPVVADMTSKGKQLMLFSDA